MKAHHPGGRCQRACRPGEKGPSNGGDNIELVADNIVGPVRLTGAFPTCRERGAGEAEKS